MNPSENKPQETQESAIASVETVDDSPEKKKRPQGTTITVNVVLFLIIAFFIVTLVSQLVNRFYNPLRTETALYYQDTESVLLKGIYIRNERQVVSEAFASAANSGAIAYTNKNGSKLAINSVIAVVYPSDEEIYIIQRIAELKEQIATLSGAEVFAGNSSGDNVQDNAQIEAFMGQLSETHFRIIQNIDAESYEQASEYKNEYLSLLSKINVVREATDGFAVRIAELEAEVVSLESQLSGSVMELTVQDSGYFVSNADGYESVLEFANARDITKGQIEDIIANPSLAINNNVAGKVIDDYKWRMATVAPSDRTKAISQDMSVNLRVGTYSRVVPATVVSKTEQEDGTAVFVFECELLNEEFVKKRISSIRLLLDDFSGIRLPQSAVTFNDEGERGVYVKNGSVILFRRINMLRSEEDFVIVENTDKEGFLQLFDEVVVRGSNLYDGKIV